MKHKEIRFRVFLKDNRKRLVKQQIKIFKREFKLGRETYYRWKKAIKLRKPLNAFYTSYRRIVNKRSKCYFCEKDFQLEVHHRNKNTKDNQRKNLLILCKKCHVRLHRLMILKPITIYVVNVSKIISMKGGITNGT